jgi:hypothetical protein
LVQILGVAALRKVANPNLCSRAFAAASSKDVSEESSELGNAGRGALDWRSADAGRPARDVWDRTNRRIDNLLQLAADPGVWAALAALIAMEVVLGLDNVVFIAPG